LQKVRNIRRKLNVGVLRRKGRWVVSGGEDKGYALRRELGEDRKGKCVQEAECVENERV
jgi:hypothetical protein